MRRQTPDGTGIHEADAFLQNLMLLQIQHQRIGTAFEIQKHRIRQPVQGQLHAGSRNGYQLRQTADGTYALVGFILIHSFRSYSSMRL